MLNQSKFTGNRPYGTLSFMKKFLSFNALLLAFLSLTSLNARAEPDKNASAQSVHVQQVSDLSKLSERSREKRLPILLFFSATHCPYCELLENEILKPMILSGDYKDRVIIAKVVLDDTDDMLGFTGEQTDMDNFTSEYNLFVTPTLLFLDASGKEINKRIIGVNTIELFGGRVDSAIANALKKLRPDSRVANNKTASKIWPANSLSR